MTDRIAELEQQLAQARDHVAELEVYALGCDAEGCTTPHSSWCERAKKTAAANDGCTCPQPWTDSPQPHAAYCWLVSPPRDEVEEMRKKVAEVIAGRNAAAVELGKAARKAIAKVEADLAEMTRLRDHALRALSREDVDLDVANLPDLIGDGLSGGGWRWENDPQDTCPQQLVDDIVGIVRPVIAGVTQQRDQARRIAVALEQETARLADERDAFRDQRNSVFQTNQRLTGEVEASDQARLRAENDTRTARRETDTLKARVTDLETELKKYVGAEPTIAEEMAYLSRCLHAVHDLCDEEKRTGILSVDVETVEQAANGEWTANVARPALPWAHVMDDSDLHLFLDDLVSAAMGRWRSDPDIPDRQVLADVEKACADWRTPGQGYRSDEPGTGEGR